MGGWLGYPDEKPRRQVQVKTFQLAKTLVTAGQYQSCVADGVCAKPSCESPGADYPVVCVDWDDAQAFAKWAGGRLPSEAEWEYAARSGGRKQAYPWGDEEPSCERAVMYYGGNGCGRNSTWPVCSKPKGNTKQGLCDMAGDVFEWLQDWYHDSYQDAPTDGSAWESPAGSCRVVRGGAWNYLSGYLRASYRFNVGFPNSRRDYFGFRLAKSVP